MRYFLRPSRGEEETVKRAPTPSERVTGQIRRTGRHSVTYSISYVEVATWAKDPVNHPRPKPEVLNLAEVHAYRMGDAFVLTAIEKAREEWTKTENTPTVPPPPSPDQVADHTNSVYREIVEIGPTRYKDHFDPDKVGPARKVLDAKLIEDESDRFWHELMKR